MESTELKKLFRLIARTSSGSEQNLEEIERQLKHLRLGASLKYEDLEVISDPQYWPFQKHWMWPDRLHIEKKLGTTAAFFKDLPKNESRIIRGLMAIFKNIALVSIILRFARPDFYAIYSFPTLQLLRIERGKNAVEEYLNYIKEMRVLKASFGVNTVAEVDEIVWTIFHYQGRYINDLLKILAKNLPENLTAKELMLMLSTNPLKIAKEYLKRGDHMTAGFWAAKAFESFLENECRQQGIYVPDGAYKRSKMIQALHQETLLWSRMENRKLLYDTKALRNNIVPGIKDFSSKDTEDFILHIEQLSQRSAQGRK
jgi:hypothetical protein